MNEHEKAEYGEKSAPNIFKTVSRLETFGIFTEILILIGIIITLTFTKLTAVTAPQIFLTTACGCFVWSFGLILRIKIGKAIAELKKY